MLKVSRLKIGLNYNFFSYRTKEVNLALFRMFFVICIKQIYVINMKMILFGMMNVSLNLK
ncbi:MAG: hypothetical protein D6677_04065 [Calditrichaeota bacterium]|nr:MAG: hypothetical protein D6677_04065 [Calditrichota bacterium]